MINERAGQSNALRHAAGKMMWIRIRKRFEADQPAMFGSWWASKTRPTLQNSPIEARKPGAGGQGPHPGVAEVGARPGGRRQPAQRRRLREGPCAGRADGAPFTAAGDAPA